MQMTKENIIFSDTVSTKKEMLAFLADQAEKLGLTTSKQAVYDSFQQRENEGTTGMMDGFAIPHAKSSEIKEAGIIIVISSKEINWDSLDGQPTRVIIALLIPENEAGTTHLKLLSKIAKLLMKSDFKEALISIQDKEVLAEYIQKRLEE